MQTTINDITLYYYYYIYIYSIHAVINIIVEFDDDDNIMCNLI